MSVSEAEPAVGEPTSRIESRSLSERVRLYVLERSGNATEIFKVTGVAKTTLGAWLKGEKALTTPVFDRICQAYGIVPTRPDIGLGDSDHVPHVQNVDSKQTSGSRPKCTEMQVFCICVGNVVGLFSLSKNHFFCCMNLFPL